MRRELWCRMKAMGEQQKCLPSACRSGRNRWCDRQTRDGRQSRLPGGHRLERLSSTPARGEGSSSCCHRPGLDLLEQFLPGSPEALTSPEVGHQVLPTFAGLEPLDVVALLGQPLAAFFDGAHFFRWCHLREGWRLPAFARRARLAPRTGCAAFSVFPSGSCGICGKPPAARTCSAVRV